MKIKDQIEGIKFRRRWMTEIELRALMKEPNLREEQIYLYRNRRKRKESTEMS